MFNWSFSFFALRTSPSCFAILAFISARSMSHAFRARSWLCHSSCRKRITPAALLALLHCPSVVCLVSQKVSYPAMCTLSLPAHCRLLRLPLRPRSWPTAIAMPWRICSAVLCRCVGRSVGMGHATSGVGRQARCKCRSSRTDLRSTDDFWQSGPRRANHPAKDCDTTASSRGGEFDVMCSNAVAHAGPKT